MRLAPIASVALAEVEAQIGPEPWQRLDQRQVTFQEFGVVPTRRQRFHDRLHGDVRIQVIPGIFG